MTTVLLVDPDAPDAGAIARAADALRHGRLVAFPTETVYGLGAHALDAAAVRRLFAAKGRPANDPLIVHVRSWDDVPPLVSRVPPIAVSLARRFWPGPLTLVLPKSAAVPADVTAGLDTVAVRAPSHPVARALLEAARIPVAAPSANLFSRPSPTQADHVLQDLGGRIDIVIDGGATTVGVESTVLDVTGDRPIMLRPGAVTREMLAEIIGDIPVQTGSVERGELRSPGLLTKHYSPRAPLTLYEGPGAFERIAADAMAAAARGQRVGLLLPSEEALRLGGPAFRVADIGSAADLAGIAARLYAALRELDADGVDIILARGIEGTDGLALALRDRLRRAADRIVQQ